MDNMVKLELTQEQAELVMAALMDKMTSDDGTLKERQDRYMKYRTLHEMVEDAADDAAGEEIA